MKSSGLRRHYRDRIHRAAGEGDLPTLRAALEAGVNVDYVISTNTCWETPLDRAVSHAQEEAVRLLLAAGANPNDPHIRLLHSAVMGGTPAILRLLLEAGARTDREDDFHWETAFLWAAEKGKADMVATWLEYSKAEISHCSGEWPLLYPLHLAARNGHAEVVRLLLEAGDDVNRLTEDGMSALHLCHRDILPQLLAAGARVDSGRFENEVDADPHKEEFYSHYRYGWTPLHCAVLRDDAELVRALLEAGADLSRHLSLKGGWGGFRTEKLIPAPSAIVDPEDINREVEVPRGSTALHLAAGHAAASIVRLLLEQGAEVDARDMLSQTPLHAAAQAGRTENARLLLAAGAEHSPCNEDGDSPILLALRGGHALCAHHLLSAGAALPADYGTPLLRAWFSGERAVFAAALAAPGAAAELATPDAYGNTLPGLAVCAGDQEAVRLLVHAGWDINACGHPSGHALALAIAMDDAPMLSLLLELGADLNVLVRSGCLPLGIALEENSRRVLPLLLAAGCSLMQEDAKGQTIIPDLVWRGSPQEFLPALLAAGVDVNERDRFNRTPLHEIAEVYTPPELVRLFLAAGADPHAVNVWGHTPLHVAEENGYSATAELLRAAMDAATAQDCITC